MLPFVLFLQVAEPTEPDRAEPDPPQQNERRNLLVGNALGIALARLSFDFGTFVAPHVMPTASFHVQGTVMFERESLVGAGGELGVRLYGGAKRPSGPFIGVYGVGGRYESETNTRDSSIISYGGAADVGWSFCTKARNVVVALGGGAELRGAQESNKRGVGSIADAFVTPGIHPRVLVQIGAFF
jgi:hypothetical protein